MTITIADIARIAHEANRAMQIVQGDPAPSPTWEYAPEWQRGASIDSVRKAFAGISPKQMHDEWCDFKYRAGWVYGPVKDADAKTHPCLVPYDDLDDGQKAKDAVFVAIVAALAPALEAE